MRVRKRSRSWLFAILLTSLTFVIVGPTPTRGQDGLRIDVAPDALVKISNPFGAVSLETWSQPYVVVSATVPAGQKAPATSPILIDNRKSLLLVSVVRRPIDPVLVINLEVKVPASTKLEVATTGGEINLRGMSSGALLKSSSGEIHAYVDSAGVEIAARSVSGSVKSSVGTASKADEHSFQGHVGTGGPTLTINTDSGPISIATMEVSAAQVAPSAETGPPKLADASSRTVGTPATSGDEDVEEGDVVRVDSQLVTLNMSVIDRSTNRGLLDLTKSDFRMFEDGTEQRIVQFDASSAPFDLILLIDLSGSTKDVLKLIRESALRFVDAARTSDRIGVITFAGKPKLVSAPTLDRNALRERVGGIQTSEGDTKLYDAIDFTLNEINSNRSKSRRTAIVLMSDGLDNSIPGVQGEGSKLPYAQLLSHIQEFDGVLYTLWLNTEYEAMNPLDTQPEAFDMGHDRMRELADQGGGIFYEVERLEDLSGAYEKVVADLGTVYSLAYRPSNKARDGKWRAIRVNVSRQNAVARGKRGYYAN
jgi:VWFA-related protein